MQRWKRWKHIGEDDDDEDPDWMKSEGAGYAIGRRIFDKSEIEVSFNSSIYVHFGLPKFGLNCLRKVTSF